jgi:hypothetical protein
MVTSNSLTLRHHSVTQQTTLGKLQYKISPSNKKVTFYNETGKGASAPFLM